MASTPLSEWNGSSDRAPDELIIVLNNKLAEECEEHQALTKKLMEDHRMAVQSQFDDMRRTFQAMFDEHGRTSERLMDEQRKTSEQRLWASEQRLQGVLQTCQRMEGQVEEARAAMQGVLQSVGTAFQRERAQRQAELQRLSGSFCDGPPADRPEAELQRLAGDAPAGGPPSVGAGGRGEPGADARTGDCATSQSDAGTQPAPTASKTTPTGLDANPARRAAALEARVAQLERLAWAAESPDAAGGGPCAVPPAGAGGGGGSEPTATSARLILVHVGFHTVCLFVALPALFLAVSAVMGAVLAVAEDWEILDGILYVGGNMVLIRLVDAVPTTASGTLLDIMVSVLSFAMLSWGISIVGLLPFCPGTAALLDAVRSAGLRHRCHKMLGSFVSVCFLMIALWPLTCLSISVVPAALLTLVEGRPYERSLLLCLGFLTQTQSHTPRHEHPVSAGGKIMTLLLAFVAVGITLGWMVGVCLQLPALSSLVGVLRRATLTRGERLLDKGVNFFIVVFAIVPLAVLPLSLVLGLLLNATEGWESIADSMMYVGGNLVHIRLEEPGPMSMSGKFVDFFISGVGVGFFGFLVATVGSLDFADKCCECLGGKASGRWPAVRFTMVFFSVVLPVTCAAVAVPLGGFVSLAEGWSFSDGWLAAMSVLVQAPSLAPPGLDIKQSDGGRIAALLLCCYALCVNIGWGAGLVVASKALDDAGSVMSGATRRLKEASGIDGEA